MKLRLRIVKNENGMHKVQRRIRLKWKDLGEFENRRTYTVFNAYKFQAYDRAVDFVEQFVDDMARARKAKRWSLRKEMSFEVE